jgi:bacillolysin/thermolysin
VNAPSTGTDTLDPGTPASARIFAEGEQARAGIDRDEIQKALLRGEQRMGKDDADQVTEYGDQAFTDVRDAFARWGLDADAGNEEIGRNWLDRSLVRNAYYDPGHDAMDFGVGTDGTPFAFSSDVIGHEFTHRLNHVNVGMPYEGESGAIDESLADTMGAAVDDDWAIGEDVVAGEIRDMSRPATMSDFAKTKADHGGVHTNSAIPNYAAYQIGSTVGRDSMGAIYARTINYHLDDHASFRTLASGTYQSAVELYGRDSAEARAVVQAWDGVLELHGDRTLFPGFEPADDTPAKQPGPAHFEPAGPKPR